MTRSGERVLMISRACAVLGLTTDSSSQLRGDISESRCAQAGVIVDKENASAPLLPGGGLGFGSCRGCSNQIMMGRNTKRGCRRWRRVRNAEHGPMLAGA